MKRLKKSYQILTTVETWFFFTIFFFATVATVINVILRKLFGLSFNWIDESSRFIMLITMCLGMSIAVTGDIHPKMDSVQAIFKGKGKKIIVLLADLVFTFIMIVGTRYAIAQELKTYKTGAALSAIPLKLWVPWMFIPIGFAGASIRGIFNIIFDIMGLYGKDPRTSEKEEVGKEGES